VSRGMKGCKPNALYRGLFHEIAIRDRKSKPDDGEFASRDSRAVRDQRSGGALRFIMTFSSATRFSGWDFYAAPLPYPAPLRTPPALRILAQMYNWKAAMESSVLSVLGQPKEDDAWRINARRER